MVKTYLVILMIAVFASCNTNNKVSDYEVDKFEEINFKKPVNDLLTEFIDSNEVKGCLLRIYFDKVDPQKTVITIKSGSYSDEFLKNNIPIGYTSINNQIVYVYSGLEQYLVDKKQHSELVKIVEDCPVKTWSIIDSFNIINVNRKGWPPFFPPPQKYDVEVDSITLNK